MNTPMFNITHSHHTVIIGGGISGLSTAWYLQQQAETQGIDFSYTILEASRHWGGKVRTELVDGFEDTPFIIEAGPDSFLTQKPWALELARDLGLDSELLGTNDDKRTVYVLKNGEPIPFPQGMALIVPTNHDTFLQSRLISTMGKTRMLQEAQIPAKGDDEDESMAEFVYRRFGQEALTWLADPLMAGIYSGDSERLSILATFPRFRQMEKTYGSLIHGMQEARQQAHRQQPDNSQKLPAFVSFKAGTQTLIDALVPRLNGNLQRITSVKSIEQLDDTHYRIYSADGDIIKANSIVLTTPAPITANLLHSVTPKSSEALREIRYLSTGTLSLAFKASQVVAPLDGFGMVIPRQEQRAINAVTISSTKFNHRAPNDYVLLRVFFGGSRTPNTMSLDDRDVLKMVRAELESIFGIQGAPTFHRLYRWWNANPQYDVGHLACIDNIEASLPSGIYLTGSAYRGVGLPDCVHQAQQTAQQLLSNLTQQVISS